MGTELEETGAADILAEATNGGALILLVLKLDLPLLLVNKGGCVCEAVKKRDTDCGTIDAAVCVDGCI